MKTYFCVTCCSVVKRPKKITPGSFIIELVLWLFFIVPGLLYSLWRIGARYKACPVCNSKNIIPSDAPLAIRLQSKLGNIVQQK